MKSTAKKVDIRWFVVGAGGQARVVIATARAMGYVDPQGCLVDDGSEKTSKPISGIPLFSLESVQKEKSHFFPAIGDNANRERLMEKMFGLGWKPVSLRHSSAITEQGIRIGWATILAMGAIVQTGARIGNCVIINTGAIIEHDVVVGDCTHIAPGSRVLGEAEIGKSVLVGAGSIILPGIKIGDKAIVGAGSVVREDVAAGATVVGAPARKV